MKRILQISTILGAAAMLSYSPPASADTGGYVRFKGMESHFHALGFATCGKQEAQASDAQRCLFASGVKDSDAGDGSDWSENQLRWAKDDGEGIIAGADFGFFRLELEGTYQKGSASQWRQNAATAGSVHQLRVFGNVVVEPFDLIELLGEFGGVEPLVKYNPAHYGISPYAMYGLGIMGGLVEELGYTRTCITGTHAVGSSNTTTCNESGGFAGGATAAVNVGAGVNIGLDQLARGFSSLSGATLPEYFKLPIEFSIGYHWQVGLDDLLFSDIGEDLGIHDGGLTYSVGLKW